MVSERKGATKPELGRQDASAFPHVSQTPFLAHS